MFSAAPKRGLMAFSVMPPEKCVGRMPAESVSQETGLNLSSTKKAARPPVGVPIGKVAESGIARGGE